MRSLHLRSLRLLGISFLVVALLFLPGKALAQEEVTVQIDPVGDSGVGGTATLVAADGGTNVTLDIRGLAAGADAQATMHAGSCAMPSASFSALPDLKADPYGGAKATGSVLFRGTEKVPLATMADGEHIIAIQSGGQVVACGVIPMLASAPTPSTLPVSGAGASSLTAPIAGVLGLCAVCAGLFLRGRIQPGRRIL
jgi:hypothetical protein